jgi:hypothetical protein
MKPGCKATIDALLNSIGVPHFLTDLIIDLGAPAYQPYDDFADGLIAAISLLGDLGAYRSFVIFGSAYPESVALDKPGGDIPRHDWLFYQTLIVETAARRAYPEFRRLYHSQPGVHAARHA